MRDGINKAPQESLGGISGGQAQCSTKAPERPDPKASVFRRIEYAESQLVRELAALKELRQRLNWAGQDVFEAFEELLKVEAILRRF